MKYYLDTLAISVYYTRMAKIRLLSDLHIEWMHGDFLVPPGADESSTTLVLAGDICEFDKISSKEGNLYRRFFLDVASRFKNTVYVAGNHEYYRGHLTASVDKFKNFLSTEGIDNIHFLNPGHVKLEGVNFVGATLWTDFNKGCPITMFEVSNTMNDYRQIRTAGYRRITSNDILSLHIQQLQYIKNTTQSLTGPTVVVTHHAPTHFSIADTYNNSRERYLNGAYVNQLENAIFDEEIVADWWLHGHTHTNFDYRIGKCRVVCNPRGYQMHGITENASFVEDYCIDIDVEST